MLAGQKKLGRCSRAKFISRISRSLKQFSRSNEPTNHLSVHGTDTRQVSARTERIFMSRIEFYPGGLRKPNTVMFRVSWLSRSKQYRINLNLLRRLYRMQLIASADFRKQRPRFAASVSFPLLSEIHISVSTRLSSPGKPDSIDAEHLKLLDRFLVRSSRTFMSKYFLNQGLGLATRQFERQLRPWRSFPMILRGRQTPSAQRKGVLCLEANSARNAY